MAGADYYTVYNTADGSGTSATVTTCDGWPNWVQGPFSSLLNGTAGTVGNGTSLGGLLNGTWQNWTWRGTPAVPETPEARQQYEAQQREFVVQQAKQAEESRAAMERAERLLVEYLAPAQRVAYEKDRFFEVVAAKARYRIYHDGAVRRLGEDGREVASYCIHPTEAIPAGDLALAKKLLLESDEAAFRRIANESLIGNAARE